MVWGCMTWQGVRHATNIDGKMDGYMYLQNLRDELMNILQYYDLNPLDMIFLYNNNPSLAFHQWTFHHPKQSLPIQVMYNTIHMQHKGFSIYSPKTP